MYFISVPQLIIVPFAQEEFPGIQQLVSFEDFRDSGIVYFFKCLPANLESDEDAIDIFIIEDATITIDEKLNVSICEE